MAKLPEGHSAYRRDRFDGDLAWASNFYLSPLTFEGIEYPSSEHAFQASKTVDTQLRQQVAAAPTPGQAKQMGRQLGLRPYWDLRVRFEQMNVVLRSKFENPDLRRLLESTTDQLLVEGNHHCDQMWGCCHCSKHAAWPGRNELGQALMRLRDRWKAPSSDVLRRVACTGHREQSLDRDQWLWVRQELDRVAHKLRDDYGMQVAIHGGATGADLGWAQAAVQAGVNELWAYMPFEEQADKFKPHQRSIWEEYTSLLADGGRAHLRWCLGVGYDVRLLHARNDAMIRDADAFVAVVDPTKTSGGTVSVLQKLSKGRVGGSRTPIICLDVVSRRTTWRRPPTSV